MLVERRITLYIFGYKLNPEISENEAWKDFSKAERIESLKAENRNLLLNLVEVEIFPLP